MTGYLQEFFQQVINGLTEGSIYALIALGYTMIYGVLRFVNFAHGDVFMIGSFAGYYVAPYLIKGIAEAGQKLPFVPPFAQYSYAGMIAVLVVAMIVCALLGIITEKIAYRPLRSRPRLTMLITAIGVSIFLEYFGQFLFGADPKSFPTLMDIHSFDWIDSHLGLTLTNGDVTILGVTLVLLITLWLIVMKTRIGMAMRALSVNPTACSLMGVNNDMVISFTFGLGSALAGAGGILYGSAYPSIDPLLGINVGLKAFVAAVLGGIGNIPGAALGGLLIGIIETMVTGYGGELGPVLRVGGGILACAGGIWIIVLAFRRTIKNWENVRKPFIILICGLVLGAMSMVGDLSSYRDAVVFGLLILILLVKPTGLLGKSEREKV